MLFLIFCHTVLCKSLEPPLVAACFFFQGSRLVALGTLLPAASNKHIIYSISLVKVMKTCLKKHKLTG